jgi:hypothetical protein
VQAVMRAFSPSNQTGGPSTVTAMRVNPAVQSSLVLNDSAGNAAINLLSQDYGAATTKIKVAISAGSTAGLKAAVSVGTTVYSQDNINQSPFSVQYTGAAMSASMTISNTLVSLFAPSGTLAASIDLTQFSTIEELVDSINVVSGFVAVETAGFANSPSLNGLDNVTSVDVKTAEYDVLANLQGVINWFNGTAQPYVTATRPDTAKLPPTPIGYTFLTGGSDGVTTSSSWDDTFSALQQADVQWITPISVDPTVWAMADAHVQYMSTTGRKERRAICGTALNTSDADAIAYAKALNSNRTSLVHLGHYATDLTGAQDGSILWSPYVTAAAVAGAFSAVSPGTPLTNKSFNFTALERNLQDPADTDPLLQGGVMPFEDTPNGIKCTQSITTWLTDDKYDKTEQSVGFACDYVSRSVRDALDPIRGNKNGPLQLGSAVSITESTLRTLAVAEPNGPGVLVGDTASPAYQNITATLVEDYIAVQFQCSPVLPDNYIGITIFAQPYSGTASA